VHLIRRHRLGPSHSWQELSAFQTSPYSMDSHSVVGQNCPESMSDTNQCPVSKLRLNGELDFAISFKVNRSPANLLIDQVMAKIGLGSYVASSKQIILLSLTYQPQSV
jgi:hypothetical protein